MLEQKSCGNISELLGNLLMEWVSKIPKVAESESCD